MSIDATLGKRLGEIAKQVCLATQVQSFDQIWDCCCDHGYLGIALLNEFSATNNTSVQVNFVDQVSHITERLQNHLRQTKFTHYRVLNIDAGKIEFDHTQRHCIIIAGVTTTGTISLLTTILNNHTTHTLDFILCPARGAYDLRRYLINSNLNLVHEVHVTENARHYEVLHVRHQAYSCLKPVSSIGELWQKGNQEHINYLKSRIEHYQNAVQDQANIRARKALQLYTTMHRKISPHS